MTGGRTPQGPDLSSFSRVVCYGTGMKTGTTATPILLFAAFSAVVLALPTFAQREPEKPAVPLTATKDGWRIYKNPRFGMQLPVPPEMTAQPPPDNGDGQAFRSADGKTELLTWGSFNIDGIGDVGKRWDAALIEPGRTISYKRKTEKWFVISGTRKDGTAFYERYDADKKYCAGWLITYPKEEEKTWSPVIERLAKGYDANLGKGSDTLSE